MRTKMIHINNRKIKPVIQNNEWDCAPSSIRMLMSYYRIPIRSEKRLLNSLNTRKDGTSVINIKKYLSHHFELYEGYGIEKAKEYLKQKHMLFVCIEDRGKYSHFVILSKIGSKYTYYLDPYSNDESRIMKKRTSNYFIKNWREYEYWFLVPIKKYKVKKYRKYKK